LISLGLLDHTKSISFSDQHYGFICGFLQPSPPYPYLHDKAWSGETMVRPISRLCLLVSLLFSLPCLSQDPSQNGSGSSVPEGVVLLSHSPSSDELTAAKTALAGGSIVEMTNENFVDFDAWLNVNIPPEGEFRSLLSASLRGKPGSGISVPLKGTLTPSIIAAHLDGSGVLHGYECEAAPLIFYPAPSGELKDCNSTFLAWTEVEQSGAATAGFALPNAANWTTEAELAEDSFDSSGNYFSDRIRLYRLNDLSPQYDWYMIVRDPTSKPNLTHCLAGFHCGWYTVKRDFQTSLDRSLVNNNGFSLYDWTPQNTITEKTGSFSLGFGLSGVVPSLDVGYAFTWPQPNVTTTVYAAILQKEASWVEAFTGSKPFQRPPITSTDAFMSHNGLIFRVPQGTLAFQTSINSRLDFIDETGTLIYRNDISHRRPIKVVAPDFSVSADYVRVPPKGKATVYLISRIPGYANRLRWEVVASPSWLQVSPASGAEGAYLTLQENGGATPGNIGYVELQTNPPYGAPSVEAGPLRIEVEVTTTFPTAGVLLAGGLPWGAPKPIATAEIWDPSIQRTRRTLNDMTEARMWQTATLLPNGKILVAGGYGLSYSGTNSADLFDPVSQTFSRTGIMNSVRFSHTATLLPNGLVLIAGGCCDIQGNALKSAELYNPANGVFSVTGSLLTARYRHTATLLGNGQVLITGGAAKLTDQVGFNSAELYDPATATFTATGSMAVPRAGQTANLLQNGSVIVAGGTSTTDSASTAELYSPFDGVFTRTGLTGTMAAKRINHAAVGLVDGRVVLAGGTNGLRTAEFYDPTPSYFYFTQGSMTEQRDSPAAALLLNTQTALDSQVLLGGGVVADTGSSNGTLLELFNPATQQFSPAGNMTTSRTGMTMTLFGQAPK
jgi:hypothetical protein